MSTQTSFRLPAELSRALARLARQRGVPKSQLVREALERYLASVDAPSAPMAVRERTATYIGAVRLDVAQDQRDVIAASIRQRNWRD